MAIAKWDCSKQEYVEIKLGKDWVPRLRGQSRLVTTMDNYGRHSHVGELWLLKLMNKNLHRLVWDEEMLFEYPNTCGDEVISVRCLTDLI